MKVVADSNFIIALAFEDDSNHRRALERWKAVQTAYLPVVAASEIAYFLLKNHFPLSKLEEILSDEKIEMEANSFADLAFALTKKDEVHSYDDFNDMLILGAARRLSMGLASFDKELERLVR